MREIKRLSKSGCCTLCRAPFAHNSLTFHGKLAGSGRRAVVGDCCLDQLEVVEGAGVQLDKKYASLLGGVSQDEPREDFSGSMAALVLGLTALQATVKSTDEELADLAKRAGYPGLETTFCYEKKPWKEDDAVWFKANPRRSHRAQTRVP